MSEHVVPFSMGELFEGSYGLTCAVCQSRGAMLWLTVEEKNMLPAGDCRHFVCEHKMGKALCKEHQPPMRSVIYRDGTNAIEENEDAGTPNADN